METIKAKAKGNEIGTAKGNMESAENVTGRENEIKKITDELTF